MLTENDIKEELSIAYTQAISAINGFAFQKVDRDRDSVDATVKFAGKLVPESTRRSPEIHVQLKATSVPEIIDGKIHFSLSIKNYNDLRPIDLANPRILVVLQLPPTPAEWLIHTHKELAMKRCAYYISLEGLPDKANQKSVTVHIPLANVLSPSKLHDLMLKSSKEESLNGNRN